MRIAAAAGALLAALMLAACGDGAIGLDRLALGERARVASVPSGDVLVLDDGLTVRLAGIATPYPGEPGGEEAKADLTRRANGRAVELLYGGARRDARGRALAQARLVDGRVWLQGALLRDGMARVRTYADNRAMAAAMLEDEARARIARRGLWGVGVFQVRLPSEVGGDSSGYQIVEGWVRAVSPTDQGAYLEFTEDRRGFAALIAPAALPDLAAAGRPAASLAGRLIRLRGVVGWNGVMRIDHPEQIEQLKPAAPSRRG